MSDQASWPDRFFCEKYRICSFPQVNSEPEGIYIGPDSDFAILGFLKFRSQKNLRVRKVEREVLIDQINNLFNGASRPKDGASQAQAPAAENVENHSIIKLIDEIIQKGVTSGASDIHFEPFERTMLCRYRINGILRHDREISREAVAEVLARIKIMSGLDISEKRRPQDGRIRFKSGEKVVDIRVSILPTDFGEKAVLRILDKETLRLDLDLLGLKADHRQLLEEKISLPNGMVLVTGPTGSGKTTTLYAVLNRLRSPGVNITTIEDPIEYNLEGINQTQIKPEINLTFANALRAILRQDPNIIMVGEIRDKETLDQALRAALTGHLVLSTLHTNDAISTISRMLDLGAESFVLGSTLKLIIAQRLVQTICPACKSEGAGEESLVAAERLGLNGQVKLYRGLGCDKCGGTGFGGRTALYEMLPIDTKLAALIASGSLEADIRACANSSGFGDLQKAGIETIHEGITTPLEVLRAVAN